MQHFLIIILSLFLLSSLSSPKSRLAAAGDNLSPSPPANDDGPAYHMGPVLASPIDLYIIWYGKWSNETHKSIIRDFIGSISSVLPRNANLLSSVSGWWKTATLYGDQTNQNVTGDISIAGEFSDQYSRSRNLCRLDMQYIVRNSAMSDKSKSRPSINGNNGMYLILTSDDVQVQDFCRAVCGFHYFTYAHVVGLTVPYAWVGNSGVQCPGFCAYPFALPPSGGMNNPPLKPPNGDVGIDGMISVIGHELAEVATNPLVNSWYGGDDPTAPHEIADLCVGVYGPGAGGGYIGQNVYRDRLGGSYNAIGVKGRKFLLQWLWNPSLEKCDGPNHNK